MSSTYVMAAIVAMAVVTFALRVVPFILPKGVLQHPFSKQVAGFMPLVIMVILVADAFKTVPLSTNPDALALVIGIFTVAVMQYRFRIPLMSILAGVAIHIAILNG